MIYKAILPLLRISTATVVINDETSQAVGTMKRYHSSKIQKLMNVLFDNVVNNVQAFNLEGEIQADIKEINTIKTWIKEKWQVNLQEEYFICENRTKIRTNPQFYYEKGTLAVWIKKDFTDKVTRFFVDQIVVAEIHPEGWIPPKSNRHTIKIFDSRFDIYEIASLYYVFNLKN